VICLTDWEKQYLSEEGNIREENLYSIGVGIDLDDTPPGTNILDKFRISQKEMVLFFGQHGVHKGILHVIKAMEYVWREKEDVALVIAGNPTAHTMEIEKKIAKLDSTHQSRVYLFKSVSEAEKRGLLQAADIFVSVSPFESFGIVFLEAWHEKLPVIGCKRGGSSKLIDEFKDGLLVEFANSPQLAGAIMELLENEETRKKMGDQGFKKVWENYTWDRIMDKWENLYHEVVRRKRESL
jgi:glycosyltransferase involved in cell wall biosynthesis